MKGAPAEMKNTEELDVVWKTLQGLTLYQILKVSPASTKSEIRESFHTEAVQFHPDQYFSAKDKELRKKAEMIYKKISEAYRILSSDETRRNYDKSLKETRTPDVPLFVANKDNLEDDEDTGVRKVGVSSTSAAGSRFYKLAQSAFASKNLQAAHMNIKIALNADPHNAAYNHFLLKIETSMNAARPKKP